MQGRQNLLGQGGNPPTRFLAESEAKPATSKNLVLLIAPQIFRPSADPELGERILESAVTFSFGSSNSFKGF